MAGGRVAGGRMLACVYARAHVYACARPKHIVRRAVIRRFAFIQLRKCLLWSYSAGMAPRVGVLQYRSYKPLLRVTPMSTEWGSVFLQHSGDFTA